MELQRQKDRNCANFCLIILHWYCLSGYNAIRILGLATRNFIYLCIQLNFSNPQNRNAIVKILFFCNKSSQMDGISKTSKNSKHFIHFKTFENEDHTLGGLLHHELLQNVDVIEMAGYQMPDPQAKMIEFKLVTKNHCTTQEADMIVKKALRDLLMKVETMETNYQNALYKFEHLVEMGD